MSRHWLAVTVAIVGLGIGARAAQAQEAVSSKELARLGFFQEVSIEPVGEPWPDDTQDLRVRVREQDAGRLDYGVGYGTEERYKAFVEIGHSNIAGTGRSVTMRAEGDSLGNSYSINFLEPWIFGYAADLRISLLAQKEERDTYTLHSTALHVVSGCVKSPIRGSWSNRTDDRSATSNT